MSGRMGARAPRLCVLAAFAGLAAVAAAAEPEGASAPGGAALFQANCAVCHGAKGTGQPGLAPPLTHYPARYAATPDGRRQLVLTLLNGMYGEIAVEGAMYDFKMPEFAKLNDTDAAAILNYVVSVVSQAPSGTEPLKPSEVAAERASPIDGADVRRRRSGLLAALGL